MDYIESLRIFRAVVEAKGFRRAAEMLSTTPPVISKGVAHSSSVFGLACSIVKRGNSLLPNQPCVSMTAIAEFWTIFRILKCRLLA
jgi:hypothetical protein